MEKLKVSNTFRMTRVVWDNPNYRQIVSMGGSRSSKSYSILQILMMELMTRKKIKITCWRNTKVTCRATILEDFQNIIMFDENVYKDFRENKQSGTFVYEPTGSKIVFEGADNVGKVLGGQQDISFFNEVTEFSKEVYLQITQRTAGKVFCDYNPSKDFWLETYRHDPESAFIRSTFKDNAFCPLPIVKQLLSYEPWEPGSYDIVDTEIFYKGHPVSPTNQPPKHKTNWLKGTANVFMWLVYGLGLGSERPNKIYHGWKKITEEEYDFQPYPYYFGLDFGIANPTAAIEVKFDGNSAFYIRERLYKPLGDIEDSLPTVLKIKVPTLRKNKDYIVGDSAKEVYINLLRDAGYMAMKALKGPGSIEAGISLVQSFTIYYVPSKNLNKEYDNYSWMVNKEGHSTDVPEKKNDHLMDALRYVITFLYRYLDIKI